MYRNAIELCQTPFCETPERFNTVDMPLATGELVVAMMNPEVLIKTNIDQSVIAAPSIRMNDSIWSHIPTDYGLQCGFGAIWDNSVYTFPWRLRTPKTMVLP